MYFLYYRIPRPGCLRSYADMLIQLARCKFYTVGPLHTAMSAILYWYAPVRSKRPVGARLHSRRGIETNPVNRSRIGSKFGLYGKANQKSGRFANVPFHSHMNKKASPVQVHFPDLLGFYGYTQVHFTYSLPVYYSLFLPKCLCFFIFRYKLLNFNLSEPPNSFFEIILPMFF